MIEFDPVLVHEWLRRSAKRFPNKTALICGQERLTYKTIDHRSDRLAQALIDAGVERHDRIVVLLDNSCESVISLYGILKAGAAFVILDGSVKSLKLKYVLGNTEAKVFITHTNKAKVVVGAFTDNPNKCRIIWVGRQTQVPASLKSSSLSWDTIFANDAGYNHELPRCIDEDLAALIYTSGSTGEPKGVMTTHHNMISVAKSVIEYLGNEENDVILNVLPLSFGYGLYQVIMAFMFGGTVVLEKSFFYIYPLLELIRREKITGFPMVPTIVAMLLKLEDLGKFDFSSVRYITNAGAALPAAHAKKIRELFPHIKIFSMYGLTECKRATYLLPEELDNRPDSVGGAIPNSEVFVVDENGCKVQPWQEGELVVRGSNVMLGYWNDPELTAKSYRPGRYPGQRILYSGDFFRTDDQGFLYFLGRKDDMIKCRGERVIAREVENILCTIAGVAEAAVTGVPDEVLGQAIKAFIVRAKDANLGEKDVLKYCSANMETYMLPKHIQFVDSLPKTPNGKIDRKKLKAGELE
ncbi:MAG: AMP-binding protein [Sedimentisphaerales bacterium]|nr:AMP-binding protein [Sedimentisphaerales bacterium]